MRERALDRTHNGFHVQFTSKVMLTGLGGVTPKDPRVERREQPTSLIEANSERNEEAGRRAVVSVPVTEN